MLKNPDLEKNIIRLIYNYKKCKHNNDIMLENVLGLI